MPITTLKCPHCAARVNYVLHVEDLAEEDGGDALKTIACPRCKELFPLRMDEIDSRAREDMRELREFSQRMGADEGGFQELLDSGGDTVEEALGKADETFGMARRALDDITLDQPSETIDAEQLLRNYFVPDVKDLAKGKTQRAAQIATERYKVPEPVAQKVADKVVAKTEHTIDHAADAASDKASQVFDDAQEQVVQALEDVQARLRKKFKGL